MCTYICIYIYIHIHAYIHTYPAPRGRLESAGSFERREPPQPAEPGRRYSEAYIYIYILYTWLYV